MVSFQRSALLQEAQKAKVRHQREAMAIARERGELISRELITRQAQYILICLRQAILNFPTRYARHILGLSDEHQAKLLLTRAAHEFLTELASFSEKAINPDWLESLEADGQEDGQHVAPATGAEIRREQKKAKIRRQKKTETMRRDCDAKRAKGQRARVPFYR